MYKSPARSALLISVSEPSHADRQALPPVRLTPRSILRGRERWSAPVLKGNPRLAAAVELVLRGEEGVLHAEANPVTGRVLMCFDPQRINAPAEVLIRSAFTYGPLAPEEMPATRYTARAFRSLLMGELACSALKGVLLSGCFPAGAIAAALMLVLIHRHD